MQKIDAKAIIESRIAECMGFKNYKFIMERVKETDVSNDPEFQRVYNAFYKIRRDSKWRQAYYDLFEKEKNRKPSFQHILQSLNKSTGNIEASFSSKMLATIDDNMPIWDRYVARILDIKITGKTKEEQLKSAVECYDRMIMWYADYLKTNNARDCIAKFDRLLPAYTWMSDVKKIDFFLWSSRD